MKNRLKEFCQKRKVSVAELCAATEFKGMRYSEEDVLALEDGDLDDFNLDLISKAAGFLRVPLHEMLFIPIEPARPINEDPICLDMAVTFVIEGWFDVSQDLPDLKKLGRLAAKVCEDSRKIDLNFTETREYAHAIVRPDFDQNAVQTMEAYLQLKD